MRVLALLALTLWLPASMARADAAEESSDLGRILITATRTPLAELETPYSTTHIDERQVERRLERTVPETLRFVPGVMVQKTAYGQGSPFLRGFTGFRTLFLIDGIRLNNSVFREGANQYWATVDPLSLEGMELVKGPSSVLYGSDAIGGTVQAFTRGPRGYGEGLGKAFRLYYRGATAESSMTVHGEGSATWGERAGFYFDSSYRDFDNLQIGEGEQRNAGYDDYGGSVKLEYFFAPDLVLTAARQTVRQDNVPRTHSTIFARSFAGTTPGTDLQRDLDQERDLTYLQLRGQSMGGFVDALKLSLSWHDQSEVEDRVRSNLSRREQGFDVDTLGLWAALSTNSSFGNWSYGFEYYRDWVDSFSTANTIQGPVADDASYDLFGLYLQNELPLGERFTAIGGGRFSYAAVKSDDVFDPATGFATSIEDDWSQGTGSLRLLFRAIPERWNFYTGVSQGFRAPNLSDLTRLDSARSGELEIPAPGLEPEEYVSFELGSKAAYGGFGIEAAYFYTDITDMIVRTPTGVTVGTDFEVTKQNVGDGYIQGVEVAGEYRFLEQWRAWGAFTWMDGEVDQFATSAPVATKQPLDRLMPVTTVLGLRWQGSALPLWAEGVFTFAQEADRLSPGDRADTQRIPPGGTPAYEVLSFYTGWNVNEHVRLTAALENVTDENYRIHGSGTNEPGINFIVGIDNRY
ncbi:MAG TPA: TonB-dependent receptor [Candidatus Limnocylindrales bacterium]|nr:TonB-dependent receptor [Candidatus Limnocylindrales bacterium]